MKKLYCMLLLCSVLMLTGCSNIPNKHEKAINEVVKLMFTCPNDNITSAFDEMTNPFNDHASAYDKYASNIINLYSPFMTDKAIQTIIATSAIDLYQPHARDLNYKISVNKVFIEKKKDCDRKYEYTARLMVISPNSSIKTNEASGIVQFNEHGKISFFNIVSDNGLKKELFGIENKKPCVEVKAQTIEPTEVTYNAFEKENLNASMDYDTVFSLCKNAVKEYTYAQCQLDNFDLDPYIQNENLKNYIKLRLCAEQLTTASATDCFVGLDKIEWNQEQNYVYVRLTTRLKSYTSGESSTTCEFIVKNLEGKLKIVDWYCSDATSADTTLRGEFQEINDPNFWNDDEKALPIIAKMKKYNGQISKMRNLSEIK